MAYFTKENIDELYEKLGLSTDEQRKEYQFEFDEKEKDESAYIITSGAELTYTE